MDSREPTHCGKMSTLRAAMGSAGRLSTPVCVDTAVLPSGRRTRTGLGVGCTFKIICLSLRLIKLPVVPMSALVYVGVESLLVASVINLHFCNLATRCALSLATPTHQAFFPPSWLEYVAESSCPGFLFWQAGEAWPRQPWVQQ